MASISMKDTSFLDPKLQANLDKSVRIQSQLRLPIVSHESNSQFSSRKDGKATTKVFQWHFDGEISRLQLAYLLVKSKTIFSCLESFLSGADAKKLVLIRNSLPQENLEKQHKKPPRRQLKEDLLYSNSFDLPAAITEINDEELLRRELSELAAERDRLRNEIELCRQFTSENSTSQYYRFTYLLYKLNMARKCASSNKTTLLTADYFSTVLAKRKLLLELVKESIKGQEESVKILLTEKAVLHSSAVACFDHWQSVDQQILVDREVEESNRIKVFPADFRVRESHFRSFDELLGQVVQATKEQIGPSKRKKPTSDSHSHEKLEADLQYQSVHSNFSVSEDFRHGLKEFEQNVGETMSRCYQLVEESVRRRNRTRAALRDDDYGLIEAKVSRTEAELQHRRMTSQRVGALLNESRQRTFESMKTKISTSHSLLAQSDQAFFSHLKAQYNDIYTQAQTLSRRKSTLHAVG